MPQNALLLALILAIQASAATGHDLPRTAMLSGDRFGPLIVGMPEKAIERVTGLRFHRDDGIGNPRACHHDDSDRFAPNLRVMVRRGRIARFSIYSGPSLIKTTTGIGLGDSTADLLRAYGDRFERSTDAGGAPIWVIWDKAAGRGLRFDLDEHGRVGAMHGGDRSIWLTEGCA